MAIAVTCSCGKKLRVDDANAGRKIRCPACERIFRLPDADEEDEDGREEARERVRADRPAAKRPARDEDDDDRDEPEARVRRRPGKKQQKSSALPLILGGVALLVLLGGASFAGYWFLLRGDNMNESAFLAPDAQFVFSVRLADVAKLDGFQKLTKATGGESLNEATAKVGLTGSDIERVTYVAQDIESKVGWGIVVLSKPYDKKAVLAKLSNARTAKHEGKTYHIGQVPGAAGARPKMAGGMMGPPGGGAQNQVIFFAGPKLLVMAEDEGSIKRGITAGVGKGATTGPLADAMKQIGGTRHATFAFTLPAGAREQAKGGIAMLGPMGKPFAPLLELTGGSGSMDFGTNIVIDLALKFPDDGRAQAAMKSFTALKAWVDADVMGKLPDPKAGAALQAALAGLTAEPRGAELTIKFQVASAVLEGMIPAGGMPMR